MKKIFHVDTLVSDKFISYLLPVLLFFIGFLFRIPLLHTEFIRTGDSIEYINVASNFASGYGFISTMKPYLFNDLPVIISGNLIRPLFTPLVYAFLLKINYNYYFLQLFNILLSSMNVAIFYLLAKFFLNKKLSFLAALLIAFNPYLILDSRFIISEQLFYCLVLSFFLIYYYLKDSTIKYSLLGIIASLSYLTRTEGGLLLIVLILLKARKPIFVGIALIASLIVCIPNFILNYTATSNLFYSPYAYQLSVLNYIQTQYQFYQGLPTPIEFITHNYKTITYIILQINKGNLQTLFGLKFLGLLSILFFSGVIRNKFLYSRNLLPIIIFMVLLYIAETVTWAVAFQPERHLALVFYLFVLLVFVLIHKGIPVKIIYPVLSLTLFIYLIITVRGLLWIRANSNIDEWKNDKSLAWIRKNTKRDDIIATYDPYLTYLYTSRPTIVLPNYFPQKIHNLNNFKYYLKVYKVNYIKVYSGEISLYNYLKKENFTTSFHDNSDAIFCVAKCK